LENFIGHQATLQENWRSRNHNSILLRNAPNWRGRCLKI